MRAVDGRARRRRPRPGPPAHRLPRRRRARTSTTSRTSQLRAALDSGRYQASSDYTAAAGFDVAVITVPTPLKESLPDLSFIESAAALAGPAPEARRARRAGVDHVPRHDARSCSCRILEEGSGLTAGRTSSSATARSASTRATTTWGLRETPKIVSGIDGASLARVERVLRIASSTRRCRSARRKEAEMAKLLENTFRHVNIALVNELAVFAHATRRQRVGVDRRRRDEAVRLHEVHPRTGRRRPLPAGRPELPLVAGAPKARQELPVRRARQRRQRPHARLRPPARQPAAQRVGEGAQRARGSCCSVSPTRRTPATSASRRRCT